MVRGRRLRKGFPHNGRCPEIQGGNRQTAPGFSPVAFGGTSPLSGTKRRGASGRNRDPLPNLRPVRPCTSRASLPVAGRLLPPHPASITNSPPPRRYLSLRGTRRARPRLRRARALHAGSLANQHGARGAAAPRRARAEARAAPPVESRIGPSRAEPSRAGGAERGRRRRGTQVSWPEAGRVESGVGWGRDATSPWVSGSRTRAEAGRHSPKAGPEGTPRALPRAPPRGGLHPISTPGLRSRAALGVRRQEPAWSSAPRSAGQGGPGSRQWPRPPLALDRCGT